jgi:glutamate carboxypeptidase
MPPYLRYATEKKAEIIALIREMAECESPSDSPVAVDRFVDLLVERTRDIACVETVAAMGFGKHLRLEFKLSGAGEDQLLALGHSDTVWPLGTLPSMPFRESEDRLWGPGVLDMKAGLAFFIYAMRALRELDIAVPCKVILLVVSDEEVGSPSSRSLTEFEARRSKSALVLEPGAGLTGKLKTARKGVGSYSVFVEGNAAHAGVDFANGASAILEAARQVLRIAEFTDLARGTTVNPGLMSGGTRINVIAAQARVDVDIRVARLSDALLLEERFRGLQPVDERCRIHVKGGLNRPPMERTPAIETLFYKARELGEAMGVLIEESSTGGGSDGNFTAALGVPTLDGLGAVGEGAHAANESILIDRIADRVALLAGLVAEIGGYRD